LLAEPVIGLGLSEVMAATEGGAFTVRLTAFEVTLPGFTTVTLHTCAVVPTVTCTCTWVAVTLDRKLPDCTRVTFPDFKLTDKPDWKPVPLMVSVCAEADPVMGLGLSEAIAGVTGAVTTRLTRFEEPLLGFTTCTVQVLAAVPTFTNT